MTPPDSLQDTAPPPCLMSIFGATGDLTKRLLLPSIYNLAAAKLLQDGFSVLGIAAEDWTDDKFREHIAASLKQFWGSDVDQHVVGWLTSRSHYHQGDFNNPASFDSLKNRIQQLDTNNAASGNHLFYLAIAPSFIATVASQLSRAGLLTEEDSHWRRLVIEKPFGNDLASAIALNAELQKNLHEDQIYRIDHFAGKDSVQDIAVFRFANAIVEPLWNRSMIDNVQITAAETVGVEARAGYYEKSGALRDMVPNHMAEMLSLVAMEPPVSFNARHMRNKQVELLASIREIKPEEVDQYAVRGQYAAGLLNGAQVPAYRTEPNVRPDSNTETYVAMRVEIDNWRWSGVPFFLRTGKRMTKAMTEIIVTFRDPPARLFPGVKQSNPPPNQLVFNLQPTPRICLSFGAKASGLRTLFDQQSMVFEFPSGSFGNKGKGYERLLHDAMFGDSTLFQRAEFVEEGWRMVQPLLDAWQKRPEHPFPNYAAGSVGPQAADDLLAVSGHAWSALVE